MKIAILTENHPDEKRVTVLPAIVEKLNQLKLEVMVASGIGDPVHITDQAYQASGATIVPYDKLLSQGDITLRIRKPSEEDVGKLKEGSIHISFLDPFNEKKLIEQIKKAGITSISMEMIPRITRAQKMDALSSQANLGGYSAVILAAEQLQKSFPMMMTAAGTLSPARVLIIGVGVAGLQAIATAKRLGARVEAFDTRPEVEEQVKSLGARFIKIDLGTTGQTQQGYAKKLTQEQLEKQQAGMKKICAQSDIVITTAQLFGRKAPRIITREIIDQMQPGSILVDMAVETGGNVEGSKKNQIVDQKGVKIIGQTNLPARVAVSASQVYGMNLFNLIETYWDQTNSKFNLDLEDEILKQCIITHQGNLVNQTINEFYQTH